MFKVFFVNLGWYSQREGRDLEEAKRIARDAGFQARIDTAGGEVGTWCPMVGYRDWSYRHAAA